MLAKLVFGDRQGNEQKEGPAPIVMAFIYAENDEERAQVKRLNESATSGASVHVVWDTTDFDDAT